MAEDDKKSKLKEKYMEFQLLQQQIQEVQQQKQVLVQQVTELSKAKESLDDLSHTKEGKKVLSQIGNNIFIKTQVEDTKNVLMNIGGNILVLKTIKEAQTYLDKELKNLEGTMGEIDSALDKAVHQLQSIQQAILKLGKD